MRFFAPILALAATALAAPAALEARQSSTTCGSTYYSAPQVRAAVNSGYNYYQQGGTACSGSCEYHRADQRHYLLGRSADSVY